MTSRIAFPSLALAGFFLTPLSLSAQAPDPQALPAAAMADAPPYATVADLVVASPLVIDASITAATRIKGAEATGVAPGDARFYVEADVVNLIRGGAAIPAKIGWLVDVHLDAKGKPPKLKKARVLAFARAVGGSAGQLQLVTRDAMLPWTPGAAGRARAIAAEVNSPDAPPVITGVKNAFHVAGSLPGEGETQIFLSTKDNRPAALSIIRRPGEEPRWSLALSELIDDSATAPRPDTLLWYRLACFLPAALPESAVAALEPADAAQARDDYRLVLEQLGPCRAGNALGVPEADAPVSGGDGPT